MTIRHWAVAGLVLASFGLGRCSKATRIEAKFAGPMTPIRENSMDDYTRDWVFDECKGCESGGGLRVDKMVMENSGDGLLAVPSILPGEESMLCSRNGGFSWYPAGKDGMCHYDGDAK